LEAIILTGGFDKPYAFGITTALAGAGVRICVIGSDAVDCPEMYTTSGLTFLNFQRRLRPDVSRAAKLWRLVAFYRRLLMFLASSRIRLVHILWNNKLVYFDRTLQLLLLKALGKKVVFTAHNVNARSRDGGDSWLNRITLWAQYNLVDAVFVHTDAMAQELAAEFSVPRRKVTVIPFGINNAVPSRGLRSDECKAALGLQQDERTILFYGAIRPYKGLEYLWAAFEEICRTRHQRYHLVIAGAPHKEAASYWNVVRQRIAESPFASQVTLRIEFVPDSETETYFLAADVLVLPYTRVYQSGVLVLAYRFGLPVVATTAGSLETEIVEGETGFVAAAADAEDLARALLRYFDSDLYRNLDERRAAIREAAEKKYSWQVVAERTVAVYRELSQ
jgi:glycosyltransferase involved in cell wall biosynthesis